jgi:hypothetical protein
VTAERLLGLRPLHLLAPEQSAGRWQQLAWHPRVPCTLAALASNSVALLTWADVPVRARAWGVVWEAERRSLRETRKKRASCHMRATASYARPAPLTKHKRTAMHKLRIELFGISGGRSLTRPFRDARRFLSPELYPVLTCTRTPRTFGICPSFKGLFSVAPCQTLALRFASFFLTL